MHNFEDELARRRAARRASEESNGQAEDRDDDDDEIPHFGWSDTFAMIIAAYQVLMPIVLAMIGVMILAYLLFRWIFM